MVPWVGGVSRFHAQRDYSNEARPEQIRLQRVMRQYYIWKTLYVCSYGLELVKSVCQLSVHALSSDSWRSAGAWLHHQAHCQGMKAVQMCGFSQLVIANMMVVGLQGAHMCLCFVYIFHLSAFFSSINISPVSAGGDLEGMWAIMQLCFVYIRRHFHRSYLCRWSLTSLVTKHPWTMDLLSNTYIYIGIGCTRAFLLLWPSTQQTGITLLAAGIWNCP